MGVFPELCAFASLRFFKLPLTKNVPKRLVANPAAFRSITAARRSLKYRTPKRTPTRTPGGGGEAFETTRAEHGVDFIYAPPRTQKH